jgi:hypothetical protein
MSAERVSGSDTDHSAGPTNIIDAVKAKLLDILMARRARQINEAVKRIEESQKVTQETMNREFTI